MLNNDKLWLKAEINKFVSVINTCIIHTTYRKDVDVYKKDLLFVNVWLDDIEKKNVSHWDVINKIFDSQSAKILTDYWRNGEWGENHNKAFTDLRKAIRERFKEYIPPYELS